MGIKVRTMIDRGKGENKMAQLYFKHGAMNSGKSIEILKVAHNYEEQQKPVMIFTSGLDTRDEVGYVSSRVGLRQQAIPVYDDTNIYELVKNNVVKPYCVLVDEVQFLKKSACATISEYCG